MAYDSSLIGSLLMWCGSTAAAAALLLLVVVVLTIPPAQATNHGHGEQQFREG
jgi:hypothetical protein